MQRKEHSETTPLINQEVKGRMVYNSSSSYSIDVIPLEKENSDEYFKQLNVLQAFSNRNSISTSIAKTFLDPSCQSNKVFEKS